MSGIVGQNTLDNSGLIKAPAGGGAWNFISKLTASSSATLDFTSGIDSTYKEYVFTFNNIHPETDNTHFSFQGNAAGGSGYNETITSTFFESYHAESDAEGGVAYGTAADQAQGTGFQNIVRSQGSDNDQSVSGYLRLFNPSSTTFVKHFFGSANQAKASDYSYNTFFAGYFNTTSAIDEIQFKMSADAIDAGDICLYGISS